LLEKIQNVNTETSKVQRPEKKHHLASAYPDTHSKKTNSYDYNVVNSGEHTTPVITHSPDLLCC